MSWHELNEKLVYPSLALFGVTGVNGTENIEVALRGLRLAGKYPCLQEKLLTCLTSLERWKDFHEPDSPLIPNLNYVALGSMGIDLKLSVIEGLLKATHLAEPSDTFAEKA